MFQSDNIILLKLRSGVKRDEREALDQIRQQCFGMIRQLICSNQGSLVDAEDIYQEMIINLVQKVRKNDFVLTCTIRTYNYEVARRLWLKQLRKKGRNKTDLDHLQNTLQCPDDIEKNMMRQERYQALHRHIDRLPEREREVLKLYYFERKKMSEIALELNLGSEQVAKNIKCKAMKKLKEKVKSRE